MKITLSLHNAILHGIKRINAKATPGERLDGMIRLRDQIQSQINDELDELFALVNLQDEPKCKKEVNTYLQGLFFPDETLEEELRYDYLVKRVSECLDSMHFYDKELFLRYLKHGSADKLVKYMKETTGDPIPKRSILNTVKRVKEYIKKEVQI